MLMKIRAVIIAVSCVTVLNFPAFDAAITMPCSAQINLKPVTANSLAIIITVIRGSHLRTLRKPMLPTCVSS